MTDVVSSPSGALRAQDHLLEKAADLSNIARALGLDDLARTIESDAQRRIDHAQIRVAVVGEIKQGKSTLINALVSEEILPTGVTPTTGAVVQIRIGKPTGPQRIHGDGRIETLPPEHFAQLSRGGLKTGDLGTLVWNVAPGILPDGLALCDTPGINDIAHFRAARSEGELPHADVLVLVLDATQLLNRTAMTYLRDAVAAVGGFEATSGAQLLIVVNRIDLIEARERPKLVAHLERELAAIGPVAPQKAAFYELFLTDARTASRDFEATTAGVQGVRDLKARLWTLAADRGGVLPRRTKAGLLRHHALLTHNAAIAAHALRLEGGALRHEIETLRTNLAARASDLTHLRTQLATAREDVLTASRTRVDAFRTHLQTDLLTNLETASQRTLSALLPASIHDAYLAFAQQEAERLRAALDLVSRQAIATCTDQVRRRLFHATMRLGFAGPTVYLDPPSIALEAGMVAVGLAGTAVMYFGNVVAGMVMTVAGPLATVALREKSLRDARARAKAELPGALDRATDMLEAQIRGVVDGHLSALDEHLRLANVELGDQLVAVLSRAQHDLTESGEGTETKHRQQALDDLQGLERRLGAIHRDLETAAS